MYVLVRALCTVKLTASDSRWPHMRGAGRSRYAPRIDTIEATELWHGGRASQAGVAGFEPVTVRLHPAEPGGVPGRPGTRIGHAPGC
jgi:hypothetical protein